MHLWNIKSLRWRIAFLVAVSIALLLTAAARQTG